MGVLATVVRSEPNNDTAWLMHASLLDDNEQKRHCRGRVSAINPNNNQAALELSRLQQPVATAPSVPPLAPRTPFLESVQCPKCGAPVQPVARRDVAHCTCCGAALRIAKAASGRIMATLADIRSDTGLLARDAM